VKKIIIFSLIIITLLISSFSPLPVKAQTTTGGLGNPIAGCTGSSDNSISAQLKCNNLIINMWKIFLGFMDTIVLALLIVVAFATILHINYDTYGVKKALPALILGVVMAHFSLLICRMVVDFAQILAATFYNGAAHASTACPANIGNGADRIACNLSEAIFGGFVNGTLSSGAGVAAATAGVGLSIAWLVFNPAIFLVVLPILLFIVLIPAGLIMILAFELYVRFYLLMFLTIISPVAWLAISWSPIQGSFKKWWGEFTKWAFVAPVVMFYLWLAIRFNQLTTNGNSTFGAYLLSIVMIWLAIEAPKTLGGAAGAMMNKIVHDKGKAGVAGYFKGADNIQNRVFSHRLPGGETVGSRLGVTAGFSTQKKAWADQRAENQQKANDEAMNQSKRAAGTGRLTTNFDWWTRQIKKVPVGQQLYNKFHDPNSARQARLEEAQFQSGMDNIKKVKEKASQNDRLESLEEKDFKAEYNSRAHKDGTVGKLIGGDEKEHKKAVLFKAAGKVTDQATYEDIRNQFEAENKGKNGNFSKEDQLFLDALHQERLSKGHVGEARDQAEADRVTQGITDNTNPAVQTNIAKQVQVEFNDTAFKNLESALNERKTELELSKPLPNSDDDKELKKVNVALGRVENSLKNNESMLKIDGTIKINNKPIKESDDLKLKNFAAGPGAEKVIDTLLKNKGLMKTIKDNNANPHVQNLAKLIENE
jgi:hypothetical protein